MKKLFTILALLLCVSSGAFAQHCAADSTLAPVVNGPPDSPGLTPTSSQLACIDSGTVVSDTIHFENYYHATPTITIQSLTIDSINNLPNGLCWETNTGSNSFAGGASGLILVSGTCTAPPGQYKLDIWVNVYIGNSPPGAPTGNANAEALTGTLLGSQNALRYYVRVKEPGKCCFGIDTTDGKLHYYVTDSSSAPCPTAGISEVNSNFTNVTVVPNPFSSASQVSFSSVVAGTYTVKMVNLLGATVSSKDVQVIRGANQIEIERNGLSAGMYLMSLSDGSNAVTRKVVIE